MGKFIIGVFKKDINIIIGCILLISLGYILGSFDFSEASLMKVYTVTSTFITLAIAYNALHIWKYSEQAKIRALFVSDIYPEFLKYKLRIDEYCYELSTDFQNEDDRIAISYIEGIKKIYGLRDYMLEHEAKVILLGPSFNEEFKAFKRALIMAEKNSMTDNYLEEIHIQGFIQIKKSLDRVDNLLIRTSQFDH